MNILARASGSFDVAAFGETWFFCPVRSAVDANGQKDRDEDFLGFEETKTETGMQYVWRTCSNLWRKKEYVLEVQGQTARYFIRVEGEGRVDSLRFFRCGAKYEAAGYLLPVANHADYTRNLRMITEESTIELGYFAPPCYCYPFYMAGCDGWVGVGLAARAGQYNFHQFLYRNQNQDACGFEVPLYGQTTVSGVWESQSLLFTAGQDAYAVIAAYAAWHYDSGWCKKADRENLPDWWKKPIFCGWGEQAALQKTGGGNQGDYATQDAYEGMMEKLDEYGLQPGVVIIDDKWQTKWGVPLPDPARWPDLRAFADAQHQKGRKVVLWFRSWYPEGLDADECIEYLCTACAADPTSTAYQARMQGIVHTLLSDDEGCYNCDGFKIDFANCMPLGKYVSAHEKGVYGVELLKRLFTLMHDLAKAQKSDALVNCSCAHPYFDEVTDQARMHDYWGTMRSAPEIFTHRARLCAAALPGVPLDMDAGGTGSKRDFHRWIKAQITLGIPDLYYLTTAGDVAFDTEDIALIRSCWETYEAQNVRRNH